MTSYPFQIVKEEGHYIVKLKDLLAAIVADLKGGLPIPLIGLRFHETVAAMVAEMCQKISKEMGINGVALSGGVFQNRLLLRRTAQALREEGFIVYTHRQVPANDGGLSLGQAIVAHHQEDVSSHTSTN
jgi:hydrogenase maturation protein HypF